MNKYRKFSHLPEGSFSQEEDKSQGDSSRKRDTKDDLKKQQFQVKNREVAEHPSAFSSIISGLAAGPFKPSNKSD